MVAINVFDDNRFRASPIVASRDPWLVEFSHDVSRGMTDWQTSYKCLCASCYVRKDRRGVGLACAL